MKKVRVKLQAVAALFLCGFIVAACDTGPKTGTEVAQDHARSYLRNELGADSTEYEELSWGPIEQRRLEFNESRMYRMYSDSVQRMEARVAALDDSIAQSNNAQNPAYTGMTSRRDAYMQDMELYRQREPDLMREYEQHPEFDGYWLEHEYRVKKQPAVRVKILLGDTVKYTPSGLIYR